MKQLILVRHAKSSWADFSQPDADRPLNDRGHKDAPVMARRIVATNLQPDALISSPAKRALTTCRYFAKAFGIAKKSILVQPQLYLASVATFYQVVQLLDDALQTVFLFSHNNGITEFANSLTRTYLDNIPTCGVFAVSVNVASWQQFADAEKQFLFFHYPKELA